MGDIATHILIAVLAVVSATMVERYRAEVLSRLLFWQWRKDLMGTYTTVWHIDPEASPDQGTATTETPVEDLVRVEWATEHYVSGTATNSRYGDYKLSGTMHGTAITLTYCAKDGSLQEHLGVVMLRAEGDGNFVGFWSQNRPDRAGVQRGATRWIKRKHE